MQKLTVAKGEKKQYEIENESISSLSFQMSTATAQALTLTDEIKVVVSLRSDKKEIEKIFSGDLLDILQIFSANDPSYWDATQKGAGVYNIPLFFGTVLNLKNGLSLFVEIQNSWQAVDACLIEMATYQDMGVTSHIPIFEKYYLNDTLKVHNYNLGSFVKGVYLNNPLDVIIDQLLIASNQFKGEYDAQTLYLDSFKRGVGSYNVDTALPFSLFNFPRLLDNLNIKITLPSALVGTEMYVVRYVMTEKIVQNYVIKTEEHNQSNMTLIKETKDVSCGCSR
ncbi:hypothetical protein FIA58_009165 [Flavobacterium jejuense]|uniref:Uncharacterized protein n=1 Tax=Flavobacterium jejuense TaxID=1544455 RepID=A0ABX0ISM6_9FLAO|nr:hypothetical protein [Flavobacterium jejuense]NHN25842.1 hypothetical protein [Flavobacterium jejuense]